MSEPINDDPMLEGKISRVSEIIKIVASKDSDEVTAYYFRSQLLSPSLADKS
jgi:hypothetical protein